MSTGEFENIMDEVSVASAMSKHVSVKTYHDTGHICLQLNVTNHAHMFCMVEISNEIETLKNRVRVKGITASFIHKEGSS